MKHTICFIATIAILLCAGHLHAQDSTKKKKNFAIEINKKEEMTEKHKKKRREVTISNKGVSVHETDSSVKSSRMMAGKDHDDDVDDEADTMGTKRFTTWAVMLDLGLNSIRDNTDYNNPLVKAYLNVPASHQNASLYDMRPSKSVNVNIYPWMIKYRALKTHGQRIYITTGIGLQLYNFRYEQPLTYTRNPNGIILDNISFKKDKLGIDYLNVPLMFTFKTRLHKNTWAVYGAGLTEGYRIASWNKQVSDARGKVKVHDAFGLADFNTCATAEFGIEGIIRFFASYQITSLYQDGFDQHPISFGLRFCGM